MGIGIRLAAAFLGAVSGFGLSANALGVASLVETPEHEDPADFFAGATEYLTVDAAAGPSFEVEAIGEIATGNSQNWMLSGRDYERYEGVISNTEQPRWVVGITVGYNVDASGASTALFPDPYRGYGAYWAGWNGDIGPIQFGHASEVSTRGRAGNFNWTGLLLGANYNFAGTRAQSGAIQYSAVPTPYTYTRWQSTLDVRLEARAKGWLLSGDDTDHVTCWARGNWTGAVDAWDDSVQPPVLLQWWPIQ